MKAVLEPQGCDHLLRGSRPNKRKQSRHSRWTTGEEDKRPKSSHFTTLSLRRPSEAERWYSPRTSRDPVRKRVMTTQVSRARFPDIPHYWLCDGRLLMLTDPENPRNVDLFKVRKIQHRVKNMIQ